MPCPELFSCYTLKATVLQSLGNRIRPRKSDFLAGWNASLVSCRQSHHSFRSRSVRCVSQDYRLGLANAGYPAINPTLYPLRIARISLDSPSILEEIFFFPSMKTVAPSSAISRDVSPSTISPSKERSRRSHSPLLDAISRLVSVERSRFGTLHLHQAMEQMESWSLHPS